MREAYSLSLASAAFTVGCAFFAVAQHRITAGYTWDPAIMIAIGLLLVTEAVALWVIVTERSA